jgi:hypothetical protein
MVGARRGLVTCKTSEFLSRAARNLWKIKHLRSPRLGSPPGPNGEKLLNHFHLESIFLRARYK